MFIYIFLFLSVVLGFYRIYPYFFSDVPFGYDPGFYRIMFYQYIQNLPNINFNNLYLWIKQAYPPFLGILGDIFHLIGYNVDFVLTFGLGFFSIITSIFIYILLKKYGKVTSFLGMILFLLSIIQFKVFWWHYYKQILGIIFILVSLYLLEKEKYLLLIFVLISLFTVHRPSGLFLILIIIANKIIRYIFCKEKIYKDLLYVILAGIFTFFIYLPLLNELILPTLKPLITTVGTGHSGTFFNRQEFAKLEFLVILLSFYGLYLKIKKEDYDYIFSGYIVGAIWVGLGLFFYNRFYIFFDIFIILLASYGLGYLYKTHKKVFILIFSMFFVGQSYLYTTYLYKYNKSLISKKEFKDITNINKLLTGNYMMMVTHKNYSPWIHGYTLKPTIAPGLFDWNNRDLFKWKKWWYSNGECKCEAIKETIEKYNKKIYIWIGDKQPQSDYSGACFKIIFRDGRSKLIEILDE